MEQRERLRSMLERGELIVAPGAYDGLSAKVIEETGHTAVYSTGGGIARSSGFPDMGLITLSETIARVTRIVDSTSLPVIVDIDTGYGNALNVMRTVRELERAGAAAIQLEDQVTPKRCGHLEGKEVVSIEEMVGKIHAAVDTRTDADLMLIARTDSRAIEGFEAAIERCQRYSEAGADIIFFEAPRSLEEMQEIPRRVDAPLLLNRVARGAKTPLVPAKTLSEWGYSIVIFPSDLQLAAIHGMRKVAAAIRETGGTEVAQDDMLSFPEREEIIGTETYYGYERKYMGKIFEDEHS